MAYNIGSLEMKTPDEELDEEVAYIEDGVRHFDAMTGDELDAKEVEAARAEEMEFIRNIPVYEEVDENESWEKTGKGPVSSKWVDVKKTDGIRSRLVARDFKPKGEKDREDLFAAMPPLEAKRLLFRLTRCLGNEFKMLFLDVRKAHLNGVCDVDAYVELPVEANAEKGKIGKLKRWLYGMRPAGHAWEKDYTDNFAKEGLVRGKASAAVFHNKGNGMICVVHGDDFTFLGREKDLNYMKSKMGEWYEVKDSGMVGHGGKCAEEVPILNRELIEVG